MWEHVGEITKYVVNFLLKTKNFEEESKRIRCEKQNANVMVNIILLRLSAIDEPVWCAVNEYKRRICICHIVWSYRYAFHSTLILTFLAFYEYIEMWGKKNQHMNVCARTISMYEWVYRRVTRQKCTLHFEAKERAVSFYPCFLSISLLMYSHNQTRTFTYAYNCTYIYIKFYCLYEICSLVLS